jgi:predicted RNA binding protein YcfA (HicA-like mRNA interferase family)
MEELMANLREAIEGCLSIEVAPPEPGGIERMLESPSGREFARMVERRGWTLLRIDGSHHIYGKEGSIVRLSVLIHGNKPLKIGLLRHLAKLANISEEDL